MKRHLASRTGFTLVEVLVVMAVLALLSALLMAAVAGATEKGRSAVCQSNLRQIGLATQLYTDDHAGLFPPSGDGKASGFEFWPANIRQYLGSERLIICPTLQAKFGDSYDGFHFLLNTTRLNYSPTPAQNRAGVGWLPRLEGSLSDPSQTWLARETNFSGEVGNVAGCLAHPWPTHHQGGSNAVFLDGHVKWLRPEAACALQRSLPRLDPFAP